MIDTNSAVDCLINDLKNDVKVESTTFLRPEVQETRREDVQTNTTDLRSEVITNGNRSKSVITSKILHDIEDQREEDVELELENFKPILNPTTPSYENNNTENILNDDKPTKEGVIRLEKNYDLSLLCLGIVHCMCAYCTNFQLIKTYSIKIEYKVEILLVGFILFERSLIKKNIFFFYPRLKLTLSKIGS